MEDLSVEHPDLEEYLDEGDGRLPHSVREHLAGCGQCSGELASLLELRRRARELPREVEPEHDLWPEISTRILAVAGRSSPADASVVPMRQRWVKPTRWYGLAAAAVILAVVTAGGTALVLNGGAGRERLAALPAARSEPPVNPVGLAAFAAAEPEYRSTVADLEAELAARRDALSPATIEVVERNLVIIDQAIAEARAALAADPTSAELPLLLSSVYRQKVELLRQVVDLTSRS